MKKQMHKCIGENDIKYPQYSFISAGCELPTQTVFFFKLFKHNFITCLTA